MTAVCKEELVRTLTKANEKYSHKQSKKTYPKSSQVTRRGETDLIVNLISRQIVERDVSHGRQHPLSQLRE